MVSVEDYDVI